MLKKFEEVGEMLTQQKSNFLKQIIFWILSIAFFFTAQQVFGADILYVVGKYKLRASDKIAIDHLEKRGFRVVVKKDFHVQCEDSSGKDLIIISESVHAREISSKLCDVAVPIFCSEPWLFDDLGMTGNKKFVDFGRKKKQQTIVITDSQNPLAGELSGEVSVCCNSFYMGWGAPGENATRVATLENDNEKCPIFAYESGVSMPGKIAPARRVGFFMFRNTAKYFTREGWALYDAAIDWAIGG
jgi:hypothetical protein